MVRIKYFIVIDKSCSKRMHNLDHFYSASKLGIYHLNRNNRQGRNIRLPEHRPRTEFPEAFQTAQAGRTFLHRG